MQVTRENLKQEIDRLNDEEIQEIAEFINFIKFRSQGDQKAIDLQKFATLYQEFAQEDQELAEEGMSDYIEQLEKEDQAL